MSDSPNGTGQPTVLITNDDGIEAPGIRALAAAAAGRGLRVVVAAPLTEASGSSAALTAVERDGRIVVQAHPLAGLPDVPAYGVAASPAFIALLGMRGAFGFRPELVLSGINRGANAGHAVLHSGTVGAALTAAGEGVHALAVSLDVLTPAMASTATGGAAIAAIDLVDDRTRNWATAAELAVDLLPALFGTPPGTVFNVNVPDAPADRLAGVRRTRLARYGQVQLSVAEAGEGFVRTAVEESTGTEPGTDVAGLTDGYATVTPLRGVAEATTIEFDLATVATAEADPRR